MSLRTGLCVASLISDDGLCRPRGGKRLCESRRARPDNGSVKATLRRFSSRRQAETSRESTGKCENGKSGRAGVSPHATSACTEHDPNHE